MTTTRPTPLFGPLPVHHHPERPFFDLAVLVPQLMDLYPTWDEDDLRAFVEEKTRASLDPEELIPLRIVYQRCLLGQTTPKIG